jgi:hypothetical protein
VENNDILKLLFMGIQINSFEVDDA